MAPIGDGVDDLENPAALPEAKRYSQRCQAAGVRRNQQEAMRREEAARLICRIAKGRLTEEEADLVLFPKARRKLRIPVQGATRAECLLQPLRELRVPHEEDSYVIVQCTARGNGCEANLAFKLLAERSSGAPNCGKCLHIEERGHRR